MRRAATIRSLLLLICLAASTQATPGEPGHDGIVDIPAIVSGSSGHVSMPTSRYSKSYGRICYDYFYGKDAPPNEVTYHGFLKFSLESLPQGSLVDSVAVRYYQYQQWNETPFTNIRLMPDPEPLDSVALFWAIESGQEASSLTGSPDECWISQRLNAAGLAAVDSCLTARQPISFGIWKNDQWPPAGAYAYGCGSGMVPCLRVFYLAPDETDIQAVRAELATYPLVAQSSDTALLTLANRGLRASDPFWAYATRAGQPPESVLVDPVAAGETASVRIALRQTGAADAFVDYYLWTDENHDPFHGNDSARLRCWAFPTGTYGAEGFDGPTFPPPGWVVINNDSGIRMWTHWTEGTKSHSGGSSTVCSGEGRNDDWLIGGPVSPTTADRDSVGFFARSYSLSAPTALEIWVMTGIQVADTLLRLRALSIAATSYSRKALSLDSLDGDTIWLGFRCLTSGTSNALFLDDIWFNRIPAAGTYEPAAGVPIRPTLTVEPNPMSGRYATARYDVIAGTRASLTLRDVLGRAVTTIALDPSGFTRIDLRGIAPGVYVATLEPSSPLISGKLIITAPR